MDKEFVNLKKKLEGLHQLIPIFAGTEQEKMVNDIRKQFEEEALEVEKRYMQIEIEYLENAQSK